MKFVSRGRVWLCIWMLAGGIQATGLSVQETINLAAPYAQQVVKAYAINLYTTLCHEFGHALAAKFLLGEPIKITLGDASDVSKAPLLSIGGVQVHDLLWMEGRTHFQTASIDRLQKILMLYVRCWAVTNGYNKDISDADLVMLLPDAVKQSEVCAQAFDRLQNQQTKLASCLVAGGAAGIVGYWLLRAVCKLAVNSYRGDQLTSGGVLRHSVVFDGVVARQLMALWPYKGSDGDVLCQNLGITVPESIKNNAGLYVLALYLLQVAGQHSAYKDAPLWQSGLRAIPSILLPNACSVGT